LGDEAIGARHARGKEGIGWFEEIHAIAVVCLSK